MSASGAVAAWLRARSPEPPSQLLARIDEMLAAYPAEGPPVDALLAVAETAMTGLLRDGCLTRESALDLLAVDALVTYAFEAAADDPETLDARTTRALARIAALAEPHGA
jgi:hypothetical protein